MEQNINKVPLSVLMHKVFHLEKYHGMILFRQYDLKPGAAGILFTLDNYGGLSQRELADMVGITPPSITVALRKMEKLGYVSRKQDETDQRIIRIEIEEAGRKCVSVVKAAMHRMEETMLDGFTNEEKLLLRRFLLQMHNNLMKQGEWEEEDLQKCFHYIDTERERQNDETI